MWILFTCENLRALRVKSSYAFLKRPPGNTGAQTKSSPGLISDVEIPICLHQFSSVAMFVDIFILGANQKLDPKLFITNRL